MDYTTLITSDISNLSITDALDHLGALIDISYDLENPEGTLKALEWCGILRQKEIHPYYLAVLDYFEANAWKNRQLENNIDDTATWRWEQPEAKKQIFLLRHAISQPKFSEFPEIFQCQVYTNLGNALSFVGRFVEALECWKCALEINPKFGMALGNHAYALEKYAQSLYDPGHTGLLLLFSRAGFAAALADDAFFEGDYALAKQGFLCHRTEIETFLGTEFLQKDWELENFPLGRSRAEIEYRRWCLYNKLFLNPLNDLDSHAIAATDVLTLPTISTDINTAHPPRIIGFFNQIKQEYASARWIFYEGITGYGKTHHSDKDVLLYNALDFSSHSLACEKLKMAYRSAYSIFDKIGFFLNFYLELGLKETQINFKKVWHKGNVLHDKFQGQQNWPFRGLFWLSQDLFDEDLKDVASPDAFELHNIRNHLEHKHFKVHEMGLPENMGAAADGDIGYSITRTDMEAKTLRLLKLVRAALIYLSLGIHHEEKKRTKTDTKVSAPIPLFPLEDHLKI